MELESLDEHWCIILKNYFFLVYDRYKVAVPCEADWCLPQLPANTSWLIAVEAPRMLIELGEINEDTRIPAMISLCEDISEYIDEYNYLPMYSTTVNALLHDGPSLGKMIVFCAFSAGYCVYLCNHNMNDHSVKEVYKAAQSIFQSQFKSWLDNNDGWSMFMTEGRKMLREKQIADYRVSLIKCVMRKGIMLTIVAGTVILLVASLKRLEH